MDGALRLMVSWYFPADETHPDGSPMIARPDTDNLDKGLKDIMTELKFWRDDAQVFSEFINKYYADVPGIGIRVTDE
jgi:Holliday junction resolvase RusA-like endonuclease